MCPSSWKSYLYDFPFFDSALAHLEPKLELFEVWELMLLAMMMICRRFISHICAFCLQNFNTTCPHPSRYPNFFASTWPVPSRSKNPYPSGPAHSATKSPGRPPCPWFHPLSPGTSPLPLGYPYMSSLILWDPLHFPLGPLGPPRCPLCSLGPPRCPP